MKAAEIMTRHVVTVGRDTPIAQAIRLMLDNRVSGLPVLDDDGKVVGIVTEGDLLRRSETGTERHRSRWREILMGPGRMASEYVRSHGRKVAEIMTRDLICATEDTAIEDIVELIERRHIKRVPILQSELLVGIVSRADLLRAVADVLDARPAQTYDDDEIRERILAELAKAAWVPRDGLEITVENGIVELRGVILEEEEREALRVVAENVPGVKAVEDRLVWIEPVSGTVIDAPREERKVTRS
jgi:CBS domain-containing protein